MAKSIYRPKRHCFAQVLIQESGDLHCHKYVIVRFPFDQKFRFEISGIPYDEWNGIFRFVEPTRPRPSSFERKYKQ